MSTAFDDTLACVLEFQRASNELTAESVTRIDEGCVIRNPAFPEVWSHNQVWVTQPVNYERAVELCERHQPDASFWQLFLEHGEPVEQLRAEGWEIEVEVHMRLTGTPDREVDQTAVIEPPEAESLELMARWVREDETMRLTEDGVRQTVDYNRLLWRARNVRRFGIRGPDGSLAAITQVFSDGQLAQVEDVYTIPEARNRGYARALVTQAATFAQARGHELTFIVADANDWPQELYGRIGFEPLGRAWLAHLPPEKLGERRASRARG